MDSSTVLFLAANPVRLQALQLGEECRLMEDKIRRSKFSERIRFRSRWAARPDDLMEALNEDTPSVLHFSGHGDGDQGLCFQSDDGTALGVSADSLAQVMRAAGRSVEIVVLNACFSEAQAQALVRHVPCVVGMPGAIGDRSAIVYAGAFYRALAAGRSVANAHEQGIAAIQLPYVDGQHRDVGRAAPTPQAPPRLLSRSGTDPDSVYLIRAPISKECLVIIRATLRDFDDEALARLTSELRRLTGDFSLKITNVEEGSVRVTVSLSSSAAQTLLQLRAAGKLSSLCGFAVDDVVEFAESQIEAKREIAALQAARIATVQRTKSIRHVAQGGSRVNRPAFQPSQVAADDDVLMFVEQGNTKEAVTILMQRYGDPVYRYCCAQLRDPALADDVRQVIFIQALRDLPRFDGSSTLRVWLFAIARHRVLDAVKKRRRAHRLRRDPPEAAADLTLVERSENELSALVHRALLLLNDKARTAVLLHYLYGFSFEEMSKITGENPRTLHARVARALDQLRTIISRNSLPSNRKRRSDKVRIIGRPLSSV